MPSTPKRLSTKTIGLSALACGVVIAGVVSTYVYFFASPSMPPSLKHIARLVSFPLYYPAGLPTGCTFNKDSLSSADNVVLFSLQNMTTGDILSISEQPA